MQAYHFKMCKKKAWTCPKNKSQYKAKARQTGGGYWKKQNKICWYDKVRGRTRCVPRSGGGGDSSRSKNHNSGRRKVVKRPWRAQDLIPLSTYVNPRRSSRLRKGPNIKKTARKGVGKGEKWLAEDLLPLSTFANPRRGSGKRR